MNEPQAWKPGDRVWLLPDADRREVKTQLPGLVGKTLPSGRVRVVYIDQHCFLVKTVEPGRIKARDIDCFEERRLVRKIDSA
jgi:hypothetical protein